MAGSLNKVILLGNVGNDPEIRQTNDGTKIANFSLATSESWKDKATGERKDRTEWHRVVVFNENLARVVEQYVKKGSKLYVEGQLQTRKWTDASGAEKYTTEIVLTRFKGEILLLDSKGGGGSLGGYGDNDAAHSRVAGPGMGDHQMTPRREQSPSPMTLSDDDIPF